MKNKYSEFPKIITPKIFKDERGYFMETWNSLNHMWPSINWVQDNESCSAKNVMRGFHWQVAPYVQAKLVRVIKGEVIDFAVDIRKNSPTYGYTWSAILNEENKCQFYIPRGFAHAFISLKDNTIFSYKCDNYYSKESERSFNVNSITLDTSPYNINMQDIILSDKDFNAKHFSDLNDNDLIWE